MRAAWTAATRVPRRMVIAHLGSGCSVTALLHGRSVDNTMGLTPTGGVVKGNRAGDLDPDLSIPVAPSAGGSRGRHELGRNAAES